jgi:osmotically-inducible protein OsmY
MTLIVSGCAPLFLAGATTSVAVLNDRRTTGTVVEDKAVGYKVEEEIQKLPGLYEHGHVSAVSYNLAVLIVGQVPDLEAQQKITNIANRVEKVKKVYNETTVGPASSLTQRTQDIWITTKVKAKISGSPELNPLRIKVITENGIVYLLGVVTLNEADIATQTAQQVSGVTRIVKLFEYLQ